MPKTITNTTIDGFLDNSFQVVQPAKGAHRSGLDAIFLAAAISENATGKLADFGAGTGAAGMAAAQRCPLLQVDLIEINPANCALMEQSLALEKNQHIAPRLNVIEADLTATGEARTASGLLENTYDHIICNPPFNAASSNQKSPNQNRAKAHEMTPELLENWIKTAAHVARAKATIVMIVRPQNLPELLKGFERRFGSIKILPLQPKPNTPANRLIIQSIFGGRGALQILPPFVVHEDNGEFARQAEEVLRGCRAVWC